MKSFEDVIRSYLDKTGQLQAISLGDETVHVTRADSAFLQSELQSQKKFNNALLLAAVLMLYLLFGLGVFLVVYYRGNTTAMFSVLGGNLFSLLVIVRWMRQLWIEKNATDLITRAAAELSPEQTASLVTTYYNLMMQGQRQMLPPARPEAPG